MIFSKINSSAAPTRRRPIKFTFLHRVTRTVLVERLPLCSSSRPLASPSPPSLLLTTLLPPPSFPSPQLSSPSVAIWAQVVVEVIHGSLSQHVVETACCSSGVFDAMLMSAKISIAQESIRQCLSFRKRQLRWFGPTWSSATADRRSNLDVRFHKLWNRSLTLRCPTGASATDRRANCGDASSIPDRGRGVQNRSTGAIFGRGL